MSVVGLGLILLVVLGMLLVGGVWVGVALGCVGWVAMTFFSNSPPGLNLATAAWASNASWELAALPLFVWMGEILYRTRLSEQMFVGLAPWLTRIPGRLLHVGIVGSCIFGMVSGSSAATCATISKIALPELKRRGYEEGIALGSLAGAGTLGILMPPSIVMVVYAVAADVSIIQMFLAGIIPAIVVMLLFNGYVLVWALLQPSRVPPSDIEMSFLAKVRNSRELIPCVLLIFAVLGAIIAGFATATESAAFGVAGALVIGAATRSLSWKSFTDSLLGATRLSCMILFILAGAAFLTVAMGFTGIPRALAEFVVALNPDRYALIAILCLMYLVLGCFLDGISMIVLTTSIVLPMIARVGIDLLWFGIFIVLLVEIAAVTPPVGFNLFVLQTMSGKESTFVARHALPFFGMLIVAIAIITMFPQIATWLPKVVMARP
jgi:tripartite ATP-independent transporter DctM subunit